jgi:hypothetical protein
VATNCARRGYRKNHYVHYALPADRDCYFRHATRGEDLLAVGASAAGVIGPWHYRCPEYPGYLRHGEDGLNGLLLAKDSDPEDRRVWGAWLMSGRMPVDAGPGEASDSLIGKWLEAGLLVHEASHYRLTATGSWLLVAMLKELCG